MSGEIPSTLGAGERPIEDVPGLTVPATSTENLSPASSRPNSARRKSWLPANTRDPVVRDNWFSEVLFVLTALDRHLASGFETTYPPALAGHCKESVWAEFIKDINRAAKLKRKHKFALVVKPMIAKVRLFRNAIDAHLDRRTKPMLIMLKYWQDILKSYGLRAELRRGGVSIDTRVPPPSTSGARRNSDIYSSSDSAGSGARSMYRNSLAGLSTSDLQGDHPIRAPFMHSNVSKMSLASARSLAIEAQDIGVAGNWELVIYSVKKRSELRSLYTRSRRYSTLSMTGSMKAGRPTTAYMLGEESSPMKSARRHSRAKVLSLEDLAKLPIPPSRSPFNLAKEEDSDSKTDFTKLNASALKHISPEIATTSSISPKKMKSAPDPLHLASLGTAKTILNTGKGYGNADVARFPAASIASDTILPVPAPNVSGPMPDAKPIIVINLETDCRGGSSSDSPEDPPCTVQNSNDSMHIAKTDHVVSRIAANRSPLSAMAITAENLASDLDVFAESSKKNSNLVLNNRFSMANFFSLASSVLPRGASASTGMSEESIDPAEAAAVQANLECQKVQETTGSTAKANRSRSSSFLTVVTPLSSQMEKGCPTVRVVTTPMDKNIEACEVKTSTLQL